MDGDGIDNGLDTDRDGDGYPDLLDSRTPSYDDLDGDGVLNSLDADMDGDGVDNAADNDMDWDGVNNTGDAFPMDITEQYDTDGDGIGDALDTNSFTLLPVTLDDEYVIDPNQSITIDPLNDFSPLAYDLNANDVLTVEASQAIIGQVSVSGDQIYYTAPSSLPTQWYLEYQVRDEHGGVVFGRIKLVASRTDPNSPVFKDVTEVNMAATGLFTPLQKLAPEAVDVRGASVPVSLHSGSAMLRPGVHVIYWQALDPRTGATQLVGQRVNIYPQIDFVQAERPMYEGGFGRIMVSLNGYSPTYPVQIPIMISGGSANNADHTLAGQAVLEIASGREGVLRFEVLSDGLVEGDETLELAFDKGVAPALNTGVYERVTLTLSEGDALPEVQAEVVDGQGTSQYITTPAGSAQLGLKRTFIARLFRWAWKPTGIIHLLMGRGRGWAAR